MPRTKGQTVEAFLVTLDHPHKAEIMALRQLILGVDPAITEEIKWNAPSFRTTEHFATVQLRAKDGVQIIFHRGAKVRATPISAMTIADPTALLTWLAQDRATVVFHNLDEIDCQRAALADLVRAWLVYV
jgi:hypothetical protein